MASLFRKRAFKVFAIGYLLKALILALVWLAVPDLPQQVGSTAKAAWNLLAGD